MSLLLLFRSIQGTPYGSYWGPHFPRRRGGHSYWNRHFPDELSLVTPPVGPGAPTSFALMLAQDAKLSFSWRTGVFKSYSGKERRSSSVDDPALWFEGSAHLVGDNTRTMRAQLAARAAQGLPFLLGLPHEEISLRAPSSGAVVPVYSTADSDWCLVGQPVYVVHQTRGAVYGVIQAVAADSVTLDVSPGLVGSRGARLMPAVPVYLDPQQGFARYPISAPDPVETMQIKARLANAGYARQESTARLALTGTATGVTFYFPTPGAAGNAMQVRFVGDAVGIDTVDTSTPNLIAYHFVPGVTTVSQMCTRIERTDLVIVAPFTGRSTSVLVGGDAFGPTSLSGGGDFAMGTIGAGATITEWRGRPVWDRGLNVDGTIADTIQSMTQVTDLGGLPLSSASATYADWGRTINARGNLVDDWQWLRAMMDALRGAWRGFWLTTGRADLKPVSVAVGELTVSAGASDVFAWWPLQRSELEIKQADGTTTRVRITDATDNGDDTVTLAIVDELDAPVTLVGVPRVVSWLEVVRLETDTVSVGVTQGQWSTALQGRAIQNLAPDVATGDDFLDDEAGVESSQPREGIEISYGTTTIRIATGTRDVTIDGELYEAAVAGRDKVAATIDSNASSGKIHLPESHAFARRWTQGLIPPKNVTVTVRRQQASGFEVIYIGNVISMQPEGHIAVFQTISTFERALSRRLPTLVASRKCAHVLGDDNCGKNIEAMKVIATVASFSGRTITVSTIGGNATGWADGGRFVHVPSGEAMTTFQQVGTDVMLHRPFSGVAIGDAVWIYPGCGKLVTICRDKFANVRRFGNAPELPTKNPMRATGFGVISS